MRLISLRIENFGKFSNTVIDLEEGLNVFLKKNGWGKSTLAAFVRIMFFGFENENAKKDVEIVKERVRYAPWNGGKYGGSVRFQANGKRYELTREFKEKAGNDTFELRDLDTNLVSDDFSGNIGEELFGINAEAFSHTVFIRQRDVETAFDPSISAKIGNMEAAADDIRNYESAEGRLSGLLSKYDPSKKAGETG
ncbi:MAG: AAA family ATPase, partial [Lachnospiraceae bacterium]|nr:AAA family ATPase [Lachnospiraceae bacterium]